MQRATSSRPVRWYTLLGLVTVPVVIAAAFLAGATPTNDDLSRIQGAIVNNDEPAVVDGKEMPLGRMLAAELFDSEREQNYTWVMADEAHATEGLRSGTYAVVVTIPEAFSTDATSYSANDSSARGARIEVATSPAAGISDTALGEMVARTAVGAFNQTITEKYLDNIYLALNSSGEQMASLHEGINKLADGSAGLSDGLGRMSANGGTLAAGADELATGTGKLADGLNTMATNGQQLATGTSGLSAGTTKLAGGLATLAEQTAALPTKADALASGVGQYVKGTQQLIDQLQVLAPKLADLPDPSSLTSLSGRLTAGLDDYSASVDHLKQAENASGDSIACPTEIRGSYGDDGCAAYLAGVKDAGARAASALGDSGTVATAAKLDKAVGTLAGTLGGITSPVSVDTTKLEQLKTTGTQVQGGVDGLAGQLGTLSEGIAQLAGGAAQLDTGATKLADGVTTYVGGVGKVAGNVDDLATGTKKFADGVGQYTGGVSKVASGSKKLASGLDKLDQNMAEKVADLPDYSSADRAALAATAASPVTTGNLGTLTVPTAARSAILLTLALWLGALVTFVLLRPVRTDTAWSTLSTPKLVARQLLPGTGVGLAQALTLSLITTTVLGLDPSQWASLTALLATASVAFMLMVQGIAAWLHAPGRVLILTAAAMMGLTTLSHTVPAWFASIAAATPLAPANDALRGALIGDPLAGAVFGLAGWALLGATLATTAIIRARHTSAQEIFGTA